MEINERIEVFIKDLLENGFKELSRQEVEEYTAFYFDMPENTRIFRNHSIEVYIYNQQAYTYLEERIFLGERNFTDFVYG